MTSVLLKDVDSKDRELQFVQLVRAGSGFIPEIEPGSALVVQRDNGKIDLVFIEYTMLGLDSASCLAVLRQSKSSVPIIVLTDKAARTRETDQSLPRLGKER